MEKSWIALLALTTYVPAAADVFEDIPSPFDEWNIAAGLTVQSNIGLIEEESPTSIPVSYSYPVIPKGYIDASYNYSSGLWLTGIQVSATLGAGEWTIYDIPYGQQLVPQLDIAEPGDPIGEDLPDGTAEAEVEPLPELDIIGFDENGIPILGVEENDDPIIADDDQILIGNNGIAINGQRTFITSPLDFSISAVKGFIPNPSTLFKARVGIGRSLQNYHEQYTQSLTTKSKAHTNFIDTGISITVNLLTNWGMEIALDGRYNLYKAVALDSKFRDPYTIEPTNHLSWQAKIGLVYHPTFT